MRNFLKRRAKRRRSESESSTATESGTFTHDEESNGSDSSLSDKKLTDNASGISRSEEETRSDRSKSSQTSERTRTIDGDGTAESGPTVSSVSDEKTRQLKVTMPLVSPLYDTQAVKDRLNEVPSLRIRREGKYFINMGGDLWKSKANFRRNAKGRAIREHHKEVFGPIEQIFKNFCETVLGIGRVKLLPTKPQGERRIIWTGKRRANHLIKHLDGTGTYVINRFPGDIFLKDKQVLGITMRRYMLCESNMCKQECGQEIEDVFGLVERPGDPTLTHRICRHMVATMLIDSEGCDNKDCYNLGRSCCRHLDIFVPEIQSFCTYNALQFFFNRLDNELKGQTFVCKPSYLYKGYGFKFLRSAAEFKYFYHMVEGKETSRHDFMVQRLVDSPFLYRDKKFDIRAFLLVVTLRHRRVVSFVHYGFCRVASMPFDPDSDSEDSNNSIKTDTSVVNIRGKALETDMQRFVCMYETQEEMRKRERFQEEGKLLGRREDRSVKLESVFGKRRLAKVKSQIRHICICLTKAIENKIWDFFGCYQLFSMDFCVDINEKVWLIEVNSYPMHEVNPISPTQRAMVPAIIMEAIGLVAETTHKSYYHLRLRKHPEDEFQDTGFLFMQNFEFIFSTKRQHRMDYKAPRGQKEKQLPFYKRIDQVDEQMERVVRRKKDIAETHRKLKNKRLRDRMSHIPTHSEETDE